MATASCISEMEDLINCPICLTDYDEKDDTSRRPKLLSCSHTVCLECLKGIQGQNKTTCPLCRKNVIKLNDDITNTIPNNSYILCIMKMKAFMKPAMNESSKKIPNICMTCGSIGKTSCQTLHSTVNIDESTLSNFEKLISLQEDASQMKELIQSNAETIVENQQHLQLYVNDLLKSLKSFELNVRSLGKESDKLVHQAYDIIVEKNPLFVSLPNDDNSISTFLSQFLSMTKSSDDDENLESLSHKMKLNFEELQSKLNSLKENHPLFQLAETINVTNDVLKLFPFKEPVDMSTDDWKEWTASTSTLTELQRNLFRLTHMISSNNKLRTEQQQITIPVQGNNKSSLIVIGLCSNGIYNQRQIHIQISTPIGRYVMQHFGKLSFSGAAKTYKFVGKPRMLYLPLNVEDPLMWLSVSMYPRSSVEVEPSDVYLMKVSDNTTTNSSWAFGFVGGNEGGPQVTNHIRKLENAEAFLFGRVVNGADLVNTISGLGDLQLSYYQFNLCWVL